MKTLKVLLEIVARNYRYQFVSVPRFSALPGKHGVDDPNSIAGQIALNLSHFTQPDIFFTHRRSEFHEIQQYWEYAMRM